MTDGVTTAMEQISAEKPQTLEQELLAVVKNCKFDLEQASVGRCENKEQTLLIQEFRNGKRSRVDGLAAFVAALSSPDAKLRVAAASILRVGFQRSLGAVQAGAVPPELAERLLRVLGRLPEAEAAQVVPAAVHAGMNAGLREETYLALDGQSDPKVRAAGYARIMQHGGMAAFPKLRELVSQEDELAAAAAFDALSAVPQAGAKERERVCQFAASELPGLSGIVASRAAPVLADCGAAYFEGLVSELERRTANASLTAGLVRSTATLCTQIRGETAASAAQCARLKRQLLLLVDDPRHPARARGVALLSLGQHFPGGDVLALAEKYGGRKEPRLRAPAGQVKRMLRRRLKGKQRGRP